MKDVVESEQTLMRLSKIIPFVILLILFGSIMAGVIGIRGRSSSPNVVLHRGQGIPVFEIMTQEGESISRQSFLGKRHVLAFFSVECKYCAREIPMWDDLLFRYPTDTIAAIAVSESELFTTQEFIRRCSSRIRYIVDREHKLKKIFKVQALPTVFLVDAEGRVHNTLIGEHGAKLSQKIFQEFLKATEVGQKPEGIAKTQSSDESRDNRPSRACDPCERP